MLEKMEDTARPLDGSDIHRLEERIGMSLPMSYKSFLLEFNGGLPAPDAFQILGMPKNPYGIVQEFFGIDCRLACSNLDETYEALKGRIPPNLLPIACTPSGDMLCLSLAGADVGEVVLWDFYDERCPPTYDNIYRVAPSFETFRAKLFRAPTSQR